MKYIINNQMGLASLEKYVQLKTLQSFFDWPELMSSLYLAVLLPCC